MSAYDTWKAKGKPYQLCRPCREFRLLLRQAGFHVDHYPNYAHQVADRPEDHDPYSSTGWPNESARWIAHALDIMPDGAPVPLPDLARAIIAAKKQNVHGTEWIKYLNWTDENGDCHHVSWEPHYDSSTSNDSGHIHISARSDMDDSDVVSASGWNPLEDDMTPADLLTTRLTNGYTINNALVTLLARTPTNLVARLDAILAAALDQHSADAQLSPEMFDELRDIRNEVNALTTANLPVDPARNDPGDNSAPDRTSATTSAVPTP
jgi:hypothetical protein